MSSRRRRFMTEDPEGSYVPHLRPLRRDEQPPGFPLTTYVKAQILDELSKREYYSLTEIGKRHRVSRRTLSRLVRELRGKVKP